MKQFEEGVHFYYTEDGLVVLTEKYHLTRGYCCGNGCRHCPFDFESVPEPKRSKLRKARVNKKQTPGKKH